MIQQNFMFNPIVGAETPFAANKLNAKGMEGLLSASKTSLSGQKGIFANILSRSLSGGQPLMREELKINPDQNIIEMFRQVLLAKGGNLEQLQVNEKGLSAIKKILVAAGFNSAKVAELFDGLKTSVGTSSVKASDLFARLRQLDEDGADRNDMLNISSSPFLQVIMSKFGMDQGQIDQALSGSTVAGEGISLQRLIEKLRGVSKQSEGIHLRYATEDRGEIENLMAAMGLESGEAGGKGEIDLETFIAALETKVRNGAGKKNIAASLAAVGERFFSAITKESSPLDSSSTETIRRILPNRMVDNEKEAISRNKSIDVKSNNSNKIEPGKVITPVEPGMDYRKLIGEKKLAGDDLKSEIPGTFSVGGNKIREVIGAEPNDDMREKKEDPSGRNMTSMGDGLKNSGRTGDAFSTTSAGSTGKTLPAYVLNQVNRQIVRSVQENTNEIHLQLKPPHLGRLHISLENVKDGVRVSIVTEQRTTREMLASHVEEMRSLLIEQGIRLEKIDVQIAFNFDQHMAQTREDANQSSGRKKSVFRISGDDDTSGAAAMEQLAALRPRQPSGLLDLII